jgi:ribosomal protein S27E
MKIKILDKSKLDPNRKFIETPVKVGDRFYCIECANCGNFIPIMQNTGTEIPTIISHNEGEGLMTACPKCRHEQPYKVEDVHFLTAK